MTPVPDFGRWLLGQDGFIEGLLFFFSQSAVEVLPQDSTYMLTYFYLLLFSNQNILQLPTFVEQVFIFFLFFLESLLCRKVFFCHSFELLLTLLTVRSFFNNCLFQELHFLFYVPDILFAGCFMTKHTYFYPKGGIFLRAGRAFLFSFLQTIF